MPYMTAQDRSIAPRAAQEMGFLGPLLTSLGLRDPVTYYEPGLDDTQVYAKYRDKITYYQSKIDLLGSDTAKRPLQKAIEPLKASVASLAPIYGVTGGSPGARDHERLGTLVQGTRDLGRDLREAAKKYGLRAPGAAPPPGEPAVTAPIVPAAAGLPAAVPAAAYYGAEEIPWGTIGLVFGGLGLAYLGYRALRRKR